MKRMKRALKIVWKNLSYVLLGAFVMTMFLAMFMERDMETSGTAAEEPLLYSVVTVFNLIVFCFVVFGIALDWYFLGRAFRKKPRLEKAAKVLLKNVSHILLALVIAGISYLILEESVSNRAGIHEERAEKGADVSGKKAAPRNMALFDKQEMLTRQKKIETLARDNPRLYVFLGLFNLTILLALFIGFLLDIYFLMRWFKKRPLGIRLVEQEKPRWGITDIVRVTLIFLSAGYAFVILQSFAAKFIPVLYNDNFRMVFNTAAMNVAGISVIFYFIVRKYGQSAGTAGLTWKKPAAAFFYALTGYVALLPVLLAIMAATFFVTRWLHYQPPMQPIVELFIKEKATSVLLMSTLFAAVFGPIAEEIFFRGFMYTAVREKLGVFGGMVCTAALFSALHAHVVGFLPIMALGLLLAYLYEKTGSLIPSITVHIIHNVGMVVVVFLMRALGT
ncbi:MAG: type II CAAX endopeptidase family protein [Candidatus Omnitrophota bacterium]